MAINMTTDSVLPPTMAPIYLNIVGIGSQSGFQCQWMCSIWSKSRFSAKMTIFDLIYGHNATAGSILPFTMVPVYFEMVGKLYRQASKWVAVAFEVFHRSKNTFFWLK